MSNKNFKNIIFVGLVAITLIVIGVVVSFIAKIDLPNTRTNYAVTDIGFLKPGQNRTKRNIFLKIAHKKPVVHKHKIIARKVSPVNPQVVKETKSSASDNSNYRYVGYLMKYNQDEAFIIKSDDLYVVKKGDLLDRDYKVLNITKEQVKLRFLPKNKLIILNMNESVE